MTSVLIQDRNIAGLEQSKTKFVQSKYS